MSNMTDREELIERIAIMNRTSQQIVNVLTQNHDPAEALEIMGIVIAGIAAFTMKVNKHAQSLGPEKNLEQILEQVSLAARRSKVVLVNPS